jgi:hypothetical protein
MSSRITKCWKKRRHTDNIARLMAQMARRVAVRRAKSSGENQLPHTLSRT